MKYRGFSILYDRFTDSWYVKLDRYTEWLATSESDAKKQIDEYLSRKITRVAA